LKNSPEGNQPPSLLPRLLRGLPPSLPPNPLPSLLPNPLPKLSPKLPPNPLPNQSPNQLRKRPLKRLPRSLPKPPRGSPPRRYPLPSPKLRQTFNAARLRRNFGRFFMCLIGTIGVAQNYQVIKSLIPKNSQIGHFQIEIYLTFLIRKD
jgi:hypothetical protein